MRPLCPQHCGERPSVIIACMTFIVSTTTPAAGQTTTAPGTPERLPLSVAVLDFATNTPSQPDLGKQIGEALTVM